MAGTHEEQQLIAAGLPVVAGVDEVGRGCWAGPVVAAAVILPHEFLYDQQAQIGIHDSKTLNPAMREQQAVNIRQIALGIGIGSVPAHLIDQFGIATATQWAMMQAILQLPILPDALIIDWVKLPELPLIQRSIVRGDSISVSVAAASIIAKVHRDQHMTAWDRRDSRYGWAEHKGYGTAQHQRALQTYGVTSLHRRSFKPVAAFLD